MMAKAPIYVRITVDGKRALVSLKTEVEIKNWDFIYRDVRTNTIRVQQR